MRMPMAILPFMIIGLVQAGVSLDRVNKFMNNSGKTYNKILKIVPKYTKHRIHDHLTEGSERG